MKTILIALGVLMVFGSSISISVDKSNENVRSIDLTNVELEFPDDETIQAFGLLGKVQCKLCKEAMGPVVKELDKHSSKEEIKKALDRACTIIPDKRLRRKCHESIEKRGDSIAESIIENLSTDNICRILEFC